MGRKSGTCLVRGEQYLHGKIGNRVVCLARDFTVGIATNSASDNTVGRRNRPSAAYEHNHDVTPLPALITTWAGQEWPACQRRPPNGTDLAQHTRQSKD
jgi:hypothetical protein